MTENTPIVDPDDQDDEDLKDPTEVDSERVDTPAVDSDSSVEQTADFSFELPDDSSAESSAESSDGPDLLSAHLDAKEVPFSTRHRDLGKE